MESENNLFFYKEEITDGCIYHRINIDEGCKVTIEQHNHFLQITHTHVKPSILQMFQVHKHNYLIEIEKTTFDTEFDKACQALKEHNI